MSHVGGRRLVAFGGLVWLVTASLALAQASPYASWDENDRHREKQLPPEPLLDRIGVKAGMVVGEVGAGAGHFTFRLAARVGPAGKVYANDIEDDRLQHLTRRAAERKLQNIVTVLGSVVDTRLPRGQLDMVVMVNTFHDLDKPIALLDNLVPTLKPGGTVVIIDYDDDKAAKALETPGHFYTLEKTLDVLGRSAFRVIRAERMPPMFMLVVVAPK